MSPPARAAPPALPPLGKAEGPRSVSGYSSARPGSPPPRFPRQVRLEGCTQLETLLLWSDELTSLDLSTCTTLSKVPAGGSH